MGDKGSRPGVEGSLLTLPLCTGYPGSLGIPHPESPPATRHRESVGRTDLKQEVFSVPKGVGLTVAFKASMAEPKITRIRFNRR